MKRAEISHTPESVPAPSKQPGTHRATHGEHLRHEALTMALYVSICLLAALASLKDTALTHGLVFELVWGTTLGLAAAHLFAFLLAGRLIEGRPISPPT